MSDTSLYLYIVINNSAKMTKGKLASQVGHAVMAVSEYLLLNDTTLYSRYKRDGQAKIVLQTDEKMMELLVDNYRCFPIYDAGKTQVKPNTLTAIGFIPMTQDIRNKKYSELATFKLL